MLSEPLRCLWFFNLKHINKTKTLYINTQNHIKTSWCSYGLCYEKQLPEVILQWQCPLQPNWKCSYQSKVLKTILYLKRILCLYLLELDIVLSDTNFVMLQSNILPLSSGSKSKPKSKIVNSKEKDWRLRKYVSPKHL